MIQDEQEGGRARKGSAGIRVPHLLKAGQRNGGPDGRSFVYSRPEIEVE
jgi:hypothetical protein